MRKLAIESRLALLALALGAVAVLGSPYPGPVARVDTRELASLVGGESDHVTAEELADWILRGRSDFRLLDLRDEASYARYHIPGAEHVPIAGLGDYPLPRNETIVLYTDGGIHASQAWILLKALGYPAVYTVLGGLDAWKDEVLFPAPPLEAAPEARAAFERMAEVSRHLGGSPRTDDAVAAESAPLAMPEPPPPASAPAVRGKKKSRDGC